MNPNKETQSNTPAYRYKNQGDRTKPALNHWRYAHLTLLYRRLQEVVQSDLIPAGGTMLDFGCAEKPYEALFRQKFDQYLGADLSDNPHADLILDQEGRLPVEDNRFDGILSTQVLEHVADPALYLSEAYRTLKPNGVLILSTHGFWPYHPVPTDYWRWTVDGLHLILKRAGFEVLNTKSVLGFTATVLQLWQDATYRKIPKRLQSAYFRWMQFFIFRIGRRHPNRLSKNADVYVIVARKPTA